MTNITIIILLIFVALNNLIYGLVMPQPQSKAFSITFKESQQLLGYYNILNMSATTLLNSVKNLKYDDRQTYNFTDISYIDGSHHNITYLNRKSIMVFENLLVFNMSFNTKYDFPNNTDFVINHNLEIYLCDHCNISQISDETFIHVRKLKKLYLRFNKITYIDIIAFAYNSKIEYIDLSWNHLKRVNEFGTLNALQSLKHLYLNHNHQLILFDTNILPNLNTFECNHCNFSYDICKILTLYPKLTHLELRRNRFHYINLKSNYECVTNNLKFLDMSHNPIKSVVLIGDQMKQFKCNSCHLSKISRYTFAKVPKLEKLMLNNNNISFIEYDAFWKSVTNLNELHLSKNQLTDFNLPNTNENTNNQYNKNNNAYITDTDLPENFNLNVLCLDGNPFKYDFNFWIFLQSYRDLKLRTGHCSYQNNFNNSFMELEYVLPDTIKTVNETKQYLNDVSMYEKLTQTQVESNETNYNDRILVLSLKDYYTNANTYSLDLSNKSIEFIDNMFFNEATSLIFLNMSYNQNFDLPKKNKIFLYQYTLTDLDLSHCDIYFIYEESFSHLPGLKHLFLNNNKITYFSFTFFKSNKELISLNLSNNYIYQISNDNEIENNEKETNSSINDEDELQEQDEFPKLRDLILSFNRNFELVGDNDFKHFTYLERFECISCNISRINKNTFKLLTFLTTLNLKNTQIGQIKIGSLNNNLQLECINLDNNKLTYLDTRVFLPLIDNLQILCFNSVNFIEFSLINIDKIVTLYDKYPYLYNNSVCEPNQIMIDTIIKKQQEAPTITSTTTIKSTTTITTTTTENTETNNNNNTVTTPVSSSYGQHIYKTNKATTITTFNFYHTLTNYLIICIHTLTNYLSICIFANLFY